MWILLLSRLAKNWKIVAILPEKKCRLERLGLLR